MRQTLSSLIKKLSTQYGYIFNFYNMHDKIIIYWGTYLTEYTFLFEALRQSRSVYFKIAL